MSSDDVCTFVAQPFAPATFVVRELRGKEALTKPYAFDVTVGVRGQGPTGAEIGALGHRAALIVRAGNPARLVTGVIASVRADGPRDHGKVEQTRFRIVPSLALLRHQTGSRIFQDMSVDQVVDRVLHRMGILTRWELTRQLPVRPYISQYEESDLAFVRRLVCEAGIYFWFDVDRAERDTFVTALELLGDTAPPIPKETVVFGDDPSAYALRGRSAPVLEYATTEGGQSSRNRVTAFTSTRRVRASVAEYREFDPARPNALLASRAGEDLLQMDQADAHARL